MIDERPLTSLNVGEFKKIVTDCICNTGYLTYKEACIKYNIKYSKLAYNVKINRISKQRKNSKLLLSERDIQICLGII